MMICETRLTRAEDQRWLISTGPNDGVYLDDKRPVVVRLISAGPKFRTIEGYIRDSREHDGDESGYEYEVQLVDVANAIVARLFTTDQRIINAFTRAGIGATIAIGWKVVKVGDERKLLNVAWEIER